MSTQSFILWCLFFFLSSSSSSSFTEAAPVNALITSLPGFNGNFPSKHYSGYVKIDEKSLFYYFVVSERNPNEDPVVLWLNGGPGCSSFDGFVYEHGPFNFEKPKTYGFVSNIIYLDSPAGVGLSYSDNQEDYKTGDHRTSLEAHTFLLKWFEQYPEFLSNPFYISGEFYAGVYVPYSGYIIGNGVTDGKFDGNSFVPFAHGMGLIPDVLFEEVTTVCNGTFYGNDNQRCKEKLEKVYNTVTEMPLPVRKRIFGRACPLGAPVRDGIVPTWPQLLKSKNLPCTDDEVANAWLNNEACLFGDHDMWVPYIGSEKWTRSLGYKILDEWRPWFFNNQVAGYLQGYANNLTFLTIKGAGHTVPEYKPKEALAFYSRWLAGEKI
ncbi:hypothetical protein MKW92_006599 [Papaver armeniacum]|nr:hypothetical protein MKW92_006599 [Papaver armeniacum]